MFLDLTEHRFGEINYRSKPPTPDEARVQRVAASRERSRAQLASPWSASERAPSAAPAGARERPQRPEKARTPDQRSQMQLLLLSTGTAETDTIIHSKNVLSCCPLVLGLGEECQRASLHGRDPPVTPRTTSSAADPTACRSPRPPAAERPPCRSAPGSPPAASPATCSHKLGSEVWGRPYV